VVGLLVAAGEERTFVREYLAKIRLHSQAPATNAVGLGPLLVFRAFEAVSPDLVPLYGGASITLAVFFVLWLAFEHARARTC
jgi:hypothetical protein